MVTAQSPSAFCHFFLRNGTKNVQFSNACRDYNYEATNTNLCEMIAISLLISKYNFHESG